MNRHVLLLQVQHLRVIGAYLGCNHDIEGARWPKATATLWRRYCNVSATGHPKRTTEVSHGRIPLAMGRASALPMKPARMREGANPA